MYRELLLGCGYRRHRIIDPLHFKNRQSPGPLPAEEEEERWKNVTTVDLNPACGPDYVMNIDRGIAMPQTDLCDMKLFEPHDFYPELLQFKTNLFDEVHAYEVLEHLGQQGDALSFFQDFDEIWRVLKPDGFLCATVPSRFSTWLWGDPGHRRTIQPATLMFLHRPHYDKQLGKTASSDYRPSFVSDWDVNFSRDDEETHSFVLQAVKPARLRAA